MSGSPYTPLYTEKERLFLRRVTRNARKGFFSDHYGAVLDSLPPNKAVIALMCAFTGGSFERGTHMPRNRSGEGSINELPYPRNGYKTTGKKARTPTRSQ